MAYRFTDVRFVGKPDFSPARLRGLLLDPKRTSRSTRSALSRVDCGPLSEQRPAYFMCYFMGYGAITCEVLAPRGARSVCCSMIGLKCSPFIWLERKHGDDNDSTPLSVNAEFGPRWLCLRDAGAPHCRCSGDNPSCSAASGDGVKCFRGWSRRLGATSGHCDNSNWARDHARHRSAGKGDLRRSRCGRKAYADHTA
jgi:hypothetical protein